MLCTKANEYVIAQASELSIEKTFECGQCFRWSADKNSVYTGVAGGRILRIREENGMVLGNAPESDRLFWNNYFDMDTDYEAASKPFYNPPYLRKCTEFGRGIHILRQEPWEALCSFIISQCNNIPRIRKIVETLCASFGEQLDDATFAFPSVARIAALTASELSPLRSGYRAQYIINSARAVCNGDIDFAELGSQSPTAAREKIKCIHGVGDKVANCFMLFGLHKMDSFPIDVWMKKALKEHFPTDFNPLTLGEYAGLAQQYIFYYARSGDNKVIAQ